MFRRKMFFSEEKNQKTFVLWGLAQAKFCYALGLLLLPAARGRGRGFARFTEL